MLGRFLEISIHTAVIQQSLQFYQSLGFEQPDVQSGRIVKGCLVEFLAAQMLLFEADTLTA